MATVEGSSAIAGPSRWARLGWITLWLAIVLFFFMGNAMMCITAGTMLVGSESSENPHGILRAIVRALLGCGWLLATIVFLLVRLLLRGQPRESQYLGKAITIGLTICLFCLMVMVLISIITFHLSL